MRCLNCGKQVLKKINVNKQFCCSYCSIVYYQKKEKLKYNCLYCGKICYSRRKVCFDCMKLSIPQKRALLKQRLNSMETNKYIY